VWICCSKGQHMVFPEKHRITQRTVETGKTRL